MKLVALLRRGCVLAFLLHLCLFSFPQQNFHVSGKILDETGKPFANVTVAVKGTRAGTSTGVDGRFELSVSSGNDVLVFSAVGYEQQEIKLNGRHELSLSMKITGSALSDVVVVGYGTQRRANVTGAVATLKADAFDDRPITRVDQALVGQVAGVTVKQNTGIPGKAFSIQLRGSGSISAGNEPGYVVDGMPLTNNSSNTGNGSFVSCNP
ncbi:MAG: carboxypeptidase-like regulatory domain-containing protein, partial [Agriterribacter sp.]